MYPIVDEFGAAHTSDSYKEEDNSTGPLKMIEDVPSETYSRKLKAIKKEIARSLGTKLLAVIESERNLRMKGTWEQAELGHCTFTPRIARVTDNVEHLRERVRRDGSLDEIALGKSIEALSIHELLHIDRKVKDTKIVQVRVRFTSLPNIAPGSVLF